MITYIIPIIIAIYNIQKAIKLTIPIVVLLASTIKALNVSINIFGIVKSIPDIIISDIPLPSPFCVI